MPAGIVGEPEYPAAELRPTPIPAHALVVADGRTVTQHAFIEAPIAARLHPRFRLPAQMLVARERCALAGAGTARSRQVQLHPRRAGGRRDLERAFLGKGVRLTERRPERGARRAVELARDPTLAFMVEQQDRRAARTPCRIFVRGAKLRNVGHQPAAQVAGQKRIMQPAAFQHPGKRRVGEGPGRPQRDKRSGCRWLLCSMQNRRHVSPSTKVYS